MFTFYCVILVEVNPFLQILQSDQAVRPRYLDGQEVTGSMRAILINWLVQVHIKFQMLQETMYMTVTIIDRFLQVGSVPFVLVSLLLMLCKPFLLLLHLTGQPSTKKASPTCWCDCHVYRL